MDKLFLGNESFSHRLNMETFTNIEKSYSTEEFNRQFPADRFLSFEKPAIDAYVKNVTEAIGGEIVKGGFNDTPEVNSVFEKAKDYLGSMSRILVNDGGENRMVFVLAKEQVKDELKKGSEDELEKSHLDAFEYSDKIVFKKKGKDIKAQFGVIKTGMSAEIEKYETEISDTLENCLMTPSEKPDLWGNRENIVVPYKVFNWNQTYYNGGSNNMYDLKSDSDGNEVGCQPAQTPEEADLNRKYNQAVYRWVDAQAELRTIDLYINHLKDTEEYELTARQMLALKF